MCASVRHGSDVTSARNVYSGNEATRFTIMRMLGTSLLTVGAPTWSALSRHSHSYRRATKAGQSTLEQAKTTIYQGEAEV